MNKFCSGQSAHDVHHSLKTALHTLEKAQQCAVLWFGEILDRKLYRELGHGSINQYAAQELGFSKSRTDDFVMLCRKLKKMPLVKDKLASGDLGYTKARVLAPVIDHTNEKGWVEFAVNNSRREVEREVKRAKREAAENAGGQRALITVPRPGPAAIVPVRVSLEMSPVQFSRYEKLWEQLRKQGGVPADRIEALLEIMAAHQSEKCPRGHLPTAEKPPVQIHVHQCPDCAQASVPTSKGELLLSEAEHDRVSCDCQVSRPGERNTTSIPPAVRRRVLAHFRHKCQRAGCRHTQYLEAHHVIPRSQGGSNNFENLTCLCSSCHKILHDYRISTTSWVKSPYPTYRWRSSPCNLPSVAVSSAHKIVT